MGKLPHVGNFRELVVYTKSRELTREIFEMSKKFPREEMYSLIVNTLLLHRPTPCSKSAKKLAECSAA